MQVFIGIILGFVVAIIVMIVTGFGQDYELVTTIDELQKELKDNKDRLKNKEIAENYRVNVNTATQFCKKYGTNFGGYCIELEKFKEILQTKGMQIFN